MDSIKKDTVEYEDVEEFVFFCIMRDHKVFSYQFKQGHKNHISKQEIIKILKSKGNKFTETKKTQRN